MGGGILTEYNQNFSFKCCSQYFHEWDYFTKGVSIILVQNVTSLLEHCISTFSVKPCFLLWFLRQELHQFFHLGAYHGTVRCLHPFFSCLTSLNSPLPTFFFFSSNLNHMALLLSLGPLFFCCFYFHPFKLV